ncbi:hypothetical protein DL770_010680 [Monosporascus sp. CRB-9-2]|nr:hypothetical protein DL770_010680 [Monosporascus sp. CRB-9-2]
MSPAQDDLPQVNPPEDNPAQDDPAHDDLAHDNPAQNDLLIVVDGPQSAAAAHDQSNDGDGEHRRGGGVHAPDPPGLAHEAAGQRAPVPNFYVDFVIPRRRKYRPLREPAVSDGDSVDIAGEAGLPGPTSTLGGVAWPIRDGVDLGQPGHSDLRGPPDGASRAATGWPVYRPPGCPPVSGFDPPTFKPPPCSGHNDANAMAGPSTAPQGHIGRAPPNAPRGPRGWRAELPDNPSETDVALLDLFEDGPGGRLFHADPDFVKFKAYVNWHIRGLGIEPTSFLSADSWRPVARRVCLFFRWLLSRNEWPYGSKLPGCVCEECRCRDCLYSSSHCPAHPLPLAVQPPRPWLARRSLYMTGLNPGVPSPFPFTIPLPSVVRDREGRQPATLRSLVASSWPEPPPHSPNQAAALQASRDGAFGHIGGRLERRCPRQEDGERQAET